MSNYQRVYRSLLVLQWESEEIWIELDWTRKSPTSLLFSRSWNVGKADHVGTFFGSGSRVRLSTLFGLKWARRLRKLTGGRAHMTSIRRGLIGLILLPLTVDALEIQMHLLRHLEIEPAEMRRMKASPMFWLHIPKCGTSFLNTLVHMPGNCPGWPENLSVNDDMFGKCFEDASRSMCPVWCDQARLHCNRNPHETHQFLNEETYQIYKGKFVALFRQPEQRLLSAWYDDADIFRADPFVSACAENRTPATRGFAEDFFFPVYLAFFWAT